MKIAVVGAGYVGLVTGVSLALSGRHRVTLVDSDASRIESLRQGSVPIEEPGLADGFRASADRIMMASSLAAIAEPDLLFVCVATPIDDAGESDLRQIHSVLAELRDRPDWHVSVRSTLPPGFSRRIPGILERQNGAHLSTNPEFLRQGTAMQDFATPARVVIGAYGDTSDAHLALLDDAYAQVDAPRMTVGVTAAELIKNAANAFLALKLSFVNEVAALSESYGVDVEDVLAGISLDPRIGSSHMRPSLGFGGSCLPKELRVIDVAGRRHGLAMHLARAAAQVNLEQQDRFVRKLLAHLPPHGGHVGLLGLSFKAGTDDMRGSPALHVARRLLGAGHTVVAYDPAVPPTRASNELPDVDIAEHALEVFHGADAVVIATEWPEFSTLDLGVASKLMRTPRMFDGRRLVDPTSARDAGFEYHAVGWPSDEPERVEMGTTPIPPEAING